MTAADLPHLKLKWAFGFPDSSAAGSQPVVVGGRLFVGSQGGTVYSLDARTGCIYWAFPETSGVRVAISIGPRSAGGGHAAGHNAYFSDVSGNAYALDAATGQLIWQRNVEDNPFARGTGSPVLHAGVLYVPMAGFEEIQAADPAYPCCTFRGSVTALDAATGHVIWKSYTIQEEPKARRTNSVGATSFGPSGGGVWATPTVDAKRQLLYVTTGNQTSGPAQPTTDAVLAFDLKTGRLRWASQVTPGDIWIAGCKEPNPNCPENIGPDDDFGAAAVLARLPDGREALIAIQKSGVGYALDPDNQGKIMWRYRFGQVKTSGAAQWGVAVDEANAYFPVSDQNLPHPGGLHAVKLATGERVWKADPQPLKCRSGPGCNAAQQAQPTVIPGIVFSGSMDGALRAYSTNDGSIVWDVDTNREYSTLNAVPAKGASLNAAGPIIVGGMLYLTSGYGYLGGRPGNVLLAFGLD
jgi:polyvinyl alcohol dehydrogenase (cytochrome)